MLLDPNCLSSKRGLAIWRGCLVQNISIFWMPDSAESRVTKACFPSGHGWGALRWLSRLHQNSLYRPQCSSLGPCLHCSWGVQLSFLFDWVDTKPAETLRVPVLISTPKEHLNLITLITEKQWLDFILA